MKARTTLPKSGKLITAYNQGPEAFRKYCLNYGGIVQDVSFEDLDGQPIRKYSIHIDGLLASVTMKTGETIRCGYGLIKE